MTTGAPKSYEELKALAGARRRRMETMFTLSQGNDPWMSGQDYRSNRADWITKLFGHLGIQSQTHVRRVFYRLVSQETAQVNGTPFVNTVNCANDLGDAIRDARYMGLIQTDLIVDRRNPEPVINYTDDGDVTADADVYEGSIDREDFGLEYSAPTIELPSASLTRKPKIGQRYHIEIWIEKSTANDVLLPLGEEYGINIVTFVGEVSATACKNLVDRAIRSGRPVRILHVTDFDPAGSGMPVAAARKIDFFAVQSGDPDLDIKLEHVALTQEQCVDYRLPRIPIKESERRAGGFEARFGEGATELDALEALHPGTLREILVEHIERYYDYDLDDEVESAIEQYEEELSDAESDMESQFKEQLAEIEDRRTAIDARFAEVLDPAQEAYDEVVEPARLAYLAILNEAEAARKAVLDALRPEIEEMEQQLVNDAEPLLERMGVALQQAVPNAETYDWPEPAEGDEVDDPLYDSTRDYMDQVDRFREHQGKADEDVGFAADRIVTKQCVFCGNPFTTTEQQLKKIYCSTACNAKARAARDKERKKAGVDA